METGCVIFENLIVFKNRFLLNGQISQDAVGAYDCTNILLYGLDRFMKVNNFTYHDLTKDRKVSSMLYPSAFSGTGSPLKIKNPCLYHYIDYPGLFTTPERFDEYGALIAPINFFSISSAESNCLYNKSSCIRKIEKQSLQKFCDISHVEKFLVQFLILKSL
jgi:hypothetical protein